MKEHVQGVDILFWRLRTVWIHLRRVSSSCNPSPFGLRRQIWLWRPPTGTRSWARGPQMPGRTEPRAWPHRNQWLAPPVDNPHWGVINNSEEICLISNYAQYIRTAWTGEAMSTCTQMPGQSKPRWEPMKRPAQELCAFSRSCGHRTQAPM